MTDESPTGQDLTWEELHPETQNLLSRRGLLLGGAGAALTFMGMAVVGCSSTASTSSTGTTAAPAAPSTTTTSTAAAAASTGSLVGGKTLYERLGGDTAITAVVGSFLANVAADSRINSFFAKTDIPNLQKSVVLLLDQATGGPQKYTGPDMETVHAGLKITVADFNAFVEDLVKTLDAANVPAAEKQELLNLLAPMQPAIVTA